MISFTNDERENENWTTGMKINENRRPTSRTWDPTSSVPEASATFDCFNHTRDTSANLKVIIQMPLQGSESEPWQSRSEQATSDLSGPLRSELENLMRRKQDASPSAPMLFLWKVEKQTSAMPVPGGYIAYILTDHIKKEKPQEPQFQAQEPCLFYRVF